MRTRHGLEAQETPPLSGGVSLDTGDPEVVGDHRIVGVIASGGFGTVFEAEHAVTGARAAVKILHAELAARPDVVLRFEREVETLQRLSHPNISRGLGAGRLDDGRPYLVMELLQGLGLRDYFEARGRLPVDEVLAIFEPLCSALSAAHAIGIVHRDVKDSNVFLCGVRPGEALGQAGAALRVVLLDFGVAKLLDAEGPGLTASRHQVGTLGCMAPEQILARPVDERTDVYALGALAYRLLVGEPVFASRSPLALQHLHLHVDPEPPSARAALPAALDAPLLRALRKDPGARQPSAAAFFAELAAAPAIAAPSTRREALAVHLEIAAAPHLLEAGDPEVLDDLDRVVEAARALLPPAGLAETMATDTALLFTIPLPADGAGADAIRSRVSAAIASLSRRLEAPPGSRSAAGTRVRVRVHAAPATFGADGAVTGGPLMELGAWEDRGAWIELGGDPGHPGDHR
jgi:eukaryotic-like serine/threonine-protein kinase